MMERKKKILSKLKTRPVEFAHKVGFTKLGELHNEWMLDMLWGKGDATLQAHRGSYKTTCVSVCLSLLIILKPSVKTCFIRKTDADVKEIIGQVSKILKSEFTRGLVREIWGVDLELVTDNALVIDSNLVDDARGTPQLMGMGIKGSMTGKHFDRIFTDDIVNLDDRLSTAERNDTKLKYQELVNLINKEKDCRIYNTGTPWHKEDAFTLMPKPKKYNCYETGIMSKAEIEEKKHKLSLSLFYANYVLKHIADERQLFAPKDERVSQEYILGGVGHVDAAYEGDDYTAFSIMSKVGDTFYLYGRAWRKHIQDCYDMIKFDYDRFEVRKIHNETNGDKGFAARDMRSKGMYVVTYPETMNKEFKISSYLKAVWENVQIVEGTDDEYIDMITDYTEDAEHDDAPDSAACLARLMYKPRKKDRKVDSYLS